MAKKEIPIPISITEKYLSTFLNAHSPLKRETGTDIWKLRNDISSYITEDEKEGGIVIWPFPVSEEFEKKAAYYPFYLSISIMLDATENISQLSIKVFKDHATQLPTGDIKPTELLLRAEWDNKVRDPHAQPHWHIHSYNLIEGLSRYSPEKQKTVLALLEEESEVKSLESLMEEEFIEIGENAETANPKTTESQSQMFRFHLSMLSDWDKEQSKSQYKNLDSTSLKTWLPQCLNYIKTQIEYLLRKFPAV